MPHLLKPAFMLVIEKARSKGVLTTLENSRLVTVKFLLVKHRARTDLENWSLRDLNTATSRG